MTIQQKVLNRLIPMLLMAAFLPSRARAAEIRPVATSRTNRAFTVLTPTGDMVLGARDMHVDITFPSGREGKGGLFVIFDPSSGLFWGDADGDPGSTQYPPGLEDPQINLNSRSKTYLSGDRIVTFTCGYPNIAVYESSGKATSLDDAEGKVLHQAIDRVQKRGITSASPTASVPFVKLLGLDFVTEPMSSGPPMQPRILSVTQRDGKWEITLKARWTTKVILDDKYQMLSASKID